jgi:hypothetical protein
MKGFILDVLKKVQTNEASFAHKTLRYISFHFEGIMSAARH